MHKPGLFGMNGFMALFFICLSVAASAQQPGYAILIEAENKQAFVVRIGEQLFVSTGQGHLVISQLKDSNYSVCLRFPKNDLAEQIFPVKIHGKDQGFQLQGSDSVWKLVNWQSKETIRPIYERDSTRILNKGIKREDGFSRLMAAVVNDSAVMYNTYTGTGFSRDSIAIKSQLPDNKNQTLTNIPASAVKTETAVIKPPVSLPANDITKNTGKDSLISIQKRVPAKDSLASSGKATGITDNNVKSIHHPTAVAGVKKLRDVTLKISRKMVFQDIDKDGQIDTVTLFVYFENADTIAKRGNASAVLVGNKAIKPSDSLGITKIQAASKSSGKSGAISCTQNATEDDLSLVRSAILKANSEDDKIMAASDAFASKCFSVDQIRVLASLFVSDKAKYRLMDAAHLHVTNPDHFRELVDMLTDKNFQRKFLSMADKRS
jgi:hypothetical protein